MSDPQEPCAKCERDGSEAGEGCPFCGETAIESDAAAPVEPATSAGLGRRELTLIAAAIIGSGAISMAALSSGNSAVAPTAPHAATAAPAAVSAPPAPADSDLAPAGWVENGDVWLGGAIKGIALEVAARNETQIWMRKVRPLLVVRCVDNRTDVFVFTDSAAAMEAQDDDHTVRVALDGGPERSERWPDSASHDALFAPDGSRLLDELGRARTLTFGYTPHNSAPVVARFDVGGLRDRLAAAARHCQP